MPTQAPKKMRPELILLIIALCQATLLAVLVALCLPYFNQEPELVRAPTRPSQATVQTTTPPPTEELPTGPILPPPEPNPYDRNDFQYEGDYLKCLREETITGIDVSAFQGEIDWKAVKASGVDIAIVRVGYRGYGTGALVEDTYARKNIQGAIDAGLRVGVYIFSQAISVEEAAEEAAFTMNIIKGYDITMPVVFDWEYVNAEARTAKVGSRTLTDCALEFCRLVEEAGYTPMVYFNTYQGLHMMHLAELKEYDFWLAWYSDRMGFPYKLRMWQYTCEGRVDGVPTNVDINIYFPN